MSFWGGEEPESSDGKKQTASTMDLLTLPATEATAFYQKLNKDIDALRKKVDQKLRDMMTASESDLNILNSTLGEFKIDETIGDQVITKYPTQSSKSKVGPPPTRSLLSHSQGHYDTPISAADSNITERAANLSRRGIPHNASSHEAELIGIVKYESVPEENDQEEDDADDGDYDANAVMSIDTDRIRDPPTEAESDDDRVPILSASVGLMDTYAVDSSEEIMQQQQPIFIESPGIRPSEFSSYDGSVPPVIAASYDFHISPQLPEQPVIQRHDERSFTHSYDEYQYEDHSIIVLHDDGTEQQNIVEEDEKLVEVISVEDYESTGAYVQQKIPMKTIEELNESDENSDTSSTGATYSKTNPSETKTSSNNVPVAEESEKGESAPTNNDEGATAQLTSEEVRQGAASQLTSQEVRQGATAQQTSPAVIQSAVAQQASQEIHHQPMAEAVVLENQGIILETIIEDQEALMAKIANSSSSTEDEGKPRKPDPSPRESSGRSLPEWQDIDNERNSDRSRAEPAGTRGYTENTKPPSQAKETSSSSTKESGGETKVRSREGDSAKQKQSDLHKMKTQQDDLRPSPESPRRRLRGGTSEQNPIVVSDSDSEMRHLSSELRDRRQKVAKKYGLPITIDDDISNGDSSGSTGSDPAGGSYSPRDSSFYRRSGEPPEKENGKDGATPTDAKKEDVLEHLLATFTNAKNEEVKNLVEKGLPASNSMDHHFDFNIKDVKRSNTHRRKSPPKSRPKRREPIPTMSPPVDELVFNTDGDSTSTEDLEMDGVSSHNVERVRRKSQQRSPTSKRKLRSSKSDLSSRSNSRQRNKDKKQKSGVKSGEGHRNGRRRKTSLGPEGRAMPLYDGEDSSTDMAFSEQKAELSGSRTNHQDATDQQSKPKEPQNAERKLRRNKSSHHGTPVDGLKPSSKEDADLEVKHSQSNGDIKRASSTASGVAGDNQLILLQQVQNKLLSDPYGDTGRYTGVMVGGKPHGQGTMHYTDGRIYSGEWRSGRWHGYGHAVFNNGDAYIGQYDNDQRHGHGRYEWSDGRVYDGGFQLDHRQGEGTYTWPDGAVYTGDFYRGLRHGKGRYIFADGSVYNGDWEHGKYHGMGECVWVDGRRYKGEWQFGQAQGHGVEHRPDGSIRHEGEWRNDRPLRQKHHPRRHHKHRVSSKNK